MKYNHLTLAKTKHSVAVATYMSEHAEKYGLNNGEMFVLGLLHDVGYLDGRDGHEKTGVALLSQMGFKENFLHAIEIHGTNPRSLSEKDITPEALLLWEADMSVDKDGHTVGFKKRLEDIETRYGKDSIAYNTAFETVRFVKESREPNRVTTRDKEMLSNLGLDNLPISHAYRDPEKDYSSVAIDGNFVLSRPLTEEHFAKLYKDFSKQMHYDLGKCEYLIAKPNSSKINNNIMEFPIEGMTTDGDYRFVQFFDKLRSLGYTFDGAMTIEDTDSKWNDGKISLLVYEDGLLARYDRETSESSRGGSLYSAKEAFLEVMADRKNESKWLNEKEFDLVSKCIRLLGVEESFDIEQKFFADNEGICLFRDYEYNEVVPLDIGLEWILDSAKRPLKDYGLSDEEVRMLAGIFEKQDVPYVEITKDEAEETELEPEI